MRRSVVLYALLLILCSMLVCELNIVVATDATQDFWETRLSSVPTARSGFGTAVVNGKIYVIGGCKASGQMELSLGPDVILKDIGGVVGTNEVYDPATNKWEDRTSMRPTPRKLFATAVYHDKIYCIGGKIPGGNITGMVQVYDPATDTWETRTSMPEPRWNIEANVVDGKIYVIGGYPNWTLNQVYDPETDSWTNKTSAPNWAFYVSLLGDKLYAYAGSSRFQIYDPSTDTWSFGEAPPSGIGGTGSALVSTTGVRAPKRVYLLGVPGRRGDPSNLAYDPVEDQWTVAADLPTTRYHFGVAVVEDRIYVIGGYTHSGWLTPGYYDQVGTNERYTPIGYGTIPPKIKVVSPENRAYPTSNIPLNFTVNKPVNWMGFSLDDQENVTVTGNTTLSGFSEGAHRLTLYAEDTMNNTGASQVCFTVDTEPPTITVLSPKNQTYTTHSVPLIFTLDENTSHIFYVLDKLAVDIQGNTTLTDLPEGSHRLKVYAYDAAGNRGASEPVYFTVDTTPPTVSILSPENVTYSNGEVWLNFTVTPPIAWMGYSLDGGENVTVTGNTTLSGLTEDVHTLTLYANDTAGNMGASDTVCFTLKRSTPPVALWTSVAIGIVILGGVVWWMSRKDGGIPGG